MVFSSVLCLRGVVVGNYELSSDIRWLVVEVVDGSRIWLDSVV